MGYQKLPLKITEDDIFQPFANTDLEKKKKAQALLDKRTKNAYDLLKKKKNKTTQKSKKEAEEAFKRLSNPLQVIDDFRKLNDVDVDEDD